MAYIPTSLVRLLVSSMELEIPLLPLEKQTLLTQTYESEKTKYKETLRKAEERFAGIQAQIYDEII